MKPAWPSENWPVNPLIRFKLEAKTMLMPTPMATSRKYALIVPPNADTTAATASAAIKLS